MQRGLQNLINARVDLQWIILSGVSTHVTEIECNRFYASQYVLFVKPRVLIKIKKIA